MSRKHISSPELYKHYYLNQAYQKGGGSYFAGRLFQKGHGQRGGGIGNFFGSLFKKALPFLTNASKQIGRAALQTGANVLADTASGQRFQDSLQNRVRETGVQLKRDMSNRLRNAISSQTGSGRKRKKSRQGGSVQPKKAKTKKKERKTKETKASLKVKSYKT
jgi:hypothetical protein